jgi:non-heme chloroperoxidase
MTARVDSVTLANGVNLQYVEQGDRSGIPMLLLHGVTDSWHSFEPVLPHLPASIRAFALTQRGHGNASRPPAGYRYTDFATDLAAFMDAIGLESAVIVGHSLGRAIAQRFAIDHPQRTLGTVLMGSFAGDAGNPVLVEVAESISMLTDPIDPDFVREFQESTLARPVSPALMETVVQESLKVPARVWRAAFAGLLEDDVAAELGKITAPTLVVTGDRDGFTSMSEVEARTREIPGARLAVYHGAGHAFHWEEPERFAADLVAFTRTLTQASPRVH